MTNVQLLAKVVANEGKRDQLEELLGALVEAARSEDGTLTFRMFADASDQNVLWFFEEYVDGAAQQRHMKSDAFKVVAASAPPLLAEPLHLIPVLER